MARDTVDSAFHDAADGVESTWVENRGGCMYESLDQFAGAWSKDWPGASFIFAASGVFPSRAVHTSSVSIARLNYSKKHSKERTLKWCIIPPPVERVGNRVVPGQLKDEEDEDEREHRPRVERRAEDVVELGPPPEITLADEILCADR